MPVAPEAVLQDQQGRAMLRFERRLSHPPDRVWKALTDPDEQRSWHPTPFELEPRKGGAVRYLPEGDVPDMAQGEVTEYEPPRLLAHTWDEDLLRWEVRPENRGTLLILTHTFDDRFKAARDAAGWQLCLDALGSLLDDSRSDFRAIRERRTADTPKGKQPDEPSGWQELNRAYEERFGIPPEKATPPPTF
jgi:uncharacterized protein YndB with AHSA1/START domain